MTSCRPVRVLRFCQGWLRSGSTVIEWSQWSGKVLTRWEETEEPPSETRETSPFPFLVFQFWLLRPSPKPPHFQQLRVAFRWVNQLGVPNRFRGVIGNSNGYSNPPPEIRPKPGVGVTVTWRPPLRPLRRCATPPVFWVFWGVSPLRRCAVALALRCASTSAFMRCCARCASSATTRCVSVASLRRCG